jgi:hypothetical protein
LCVIVLEKTQGQKQKFNSPKPSRHPFLFPFSHNEEFDRTKGQKETHKAKKYAWKNANFYKVPRQAKQMY